MLFCNLALAPLVYAMEWPIRYKETADTTATLEVSLDPPAVPLPEVQQEISILDRTRERLESSVVGNIKRAYAVSLASAKQRAEMIISRFARSFKDDQIKTSSLSFLSTNQEPAQEPRLSVIAHVIGAPPPDPELKGALDVLARQNLLREQAEYRAAIDDFSGIRDALLTELEVELRRQIDQGLENRAPGTTGLSLLGKFNAVQLPQQANIKVIPSTQRWPTFESLAADMEMRRGLAESAVLLKIQQLQLQFVEELTREIAKALKAAVIRIRAGGEPKR